MFFWDFLNFILLGRCSIVLTTYVTTKMNMSSSEKVRLTNFETGLTVLAGNRAVCNWCIQLVKEAIIDDHYLLPVGKTSARA